MWSRRRLLPALLLLAFAVLPLRAQADPIQITSGFLDVAGLGQVGRFHFVGKDFDASGTLEPGVVGPEACFLCVPGDRIELSTNYQALIGFGTATVDGTAFPERSLRFGGNLFFNAPSFIAPSTAGDFTVTDAFTFSGTLTGALNTPLEPLVFERTLTGQGDVTAFFLENPNFPGDPPLFAFKSVRFDFTSADAVPEPATLLLLGTGVCAGLRWRKRCAR